MLAVCLLFGQYSTAAIDQGLHYATNNAACMRAAYPELKSLVPQ